MICNHPDHNENENCRERAVGCNPKCECCLDEFAIAYYEEWVEVVSEDIFNKEFARAYLEE
jgi:hypothetical protein